MAKQEPWFIHERAEWFASLVLTKHNDVKVQPYSGTDTALDLLVEVLKDGRPTLRFFGVQLVPYMDLPNLPNADGWALSQRGKEPLDAALPLCVFVIGVRKPEGIYRWVAGPVVEDGRAVLRPDVAANWQPLDEAGGPTPNLLRAADKAARREK